MKTRKRVLSLALALLLCTALSAPASAEKNANTNIRWFDVAVPSWAEELMEANYVEELGILSCKVVNFFDIEYINIDLKTGERTDKYGDCLIYPFSDGRARIEKQDLTEGGYRYGFMDTTGKIVVEPIYEYADNFHDGYARVYREGYQGLIDVDGNEVFPTRVYKVDVVGAGWNFSNGLAVVESLDGQTQVIDTQLKTVATPDKDETFIQFSEGFAVTSMGSQVGVLDNQGKPMYTDIFEKYAHVYYTRPNDLICVRDGIPQKYGFVNKTGEVVIPLQYDYASEFSDGLAYVITGEERGFIDETGKMVFTLDYQPFASFANMEGYFVGSVVPVYRGSETDQLFQNGFLPIFFKKNEADTKFLFTCLDKTGKEVAKWNEIETRHMTVHENGLISVNDIYERPLHDYYDVEGNIVASGPGARAVLSSIEPKIDYEYIAILEGGKLGWFKVFGDTPMPDPQPTDPQPTEPQPTEPQPTEPQPTEPQPTEPQPTEPQPTEPQPTEPQPTEPQPTEPQPTEPQPTEPQPTEPQPTEPQPTEPQPTEPQPTTPANPEPEDVLVVPEDAETYTLPVDVEIGDGQELEIRVQGGGKATVEVPVKDAGPGAVVVVVREDGSEEVVRDCVLTEDGLLFDVEGSVTVKLEDRAGAFTDMAGEQTWARDAVAYVSARGLFNGTTVDTFAPGEDTTRGMTATVLFRLMYEPETAASTFGDVPSGQYYADAVAWAQANGIVNGYEDGTFRPDQAITREELATILYRLAAYRGLDMTVTDSLDGYKDGGEVSGFARDAMAWCVANGIINGVDTDVLAPAELATRAQLAAVLMRMCQLAAK